MVNRASKAHDSLEDELDAIRLSIYEEIKDMTPEEEENYFRTRTDPNIKQFNMKISPLRPVRPVKRQEILAE